MYLQILPFGERAYLPVDSFGQYVPFLEYFEKILDGKASIFYSLGKSLGGEMYGLFTYYLISPFNFILLFLKRSTFVFNLLIVLKSASLGITFCYFLNRRKKAKFTNLIFSSMYALSVFTITYGFNIMWLDSMILLPLVLAGIEDLIKLKKTGLYCISLSLTLITNYYMGFMVCVFSAMYFLYKLILEMPEKSKTFEDINSNSLEFKIKKKDKTKNKEIIKTIGRFSLYSIIAACIAGLVLIPSFIGLKNGRADFSWQNIGENYNFVLQDGLSKFFTNSFKISEIGNDAMPPIFCGVVINFLCLLYFTNSKIKIKEKILSFIMLLIFFVSFYIRRINLLWTIGNVPAFYIYRYAFCFVFMYIIIAARSFENIKEGTNTWNTILAVFIYEIIGICVIRFNLGTANKIWVRTDLVLVLILGIIIEASKIDIKNTNTKIKSFIKKYKTKAISVTLFIIALTNILINDAYAMRVIRDETGPRTLEDHDTIRIYYDYRHNKLSEYDNEVFRIDCKINATLNEGLISGDNTINHSSSTYSKSLYDFLKKLGYSVEHVIITNGKGNTRAMDMLFGIKYKTEEPLNKENMEEIDLEKNIKLYKNKYALNLGFSVPNSILEESEMSQYNAIESQNNLLKKIANFNEEIFIRNQGKIKETIENLTLNQNNIYETINKEEVGKLIYEFEIEKKEQVYADISLGFELEKVKISVNGETILGGSQGSLNKLIDMGKFEVGEKVRLEFETDNEPFRVYSEHMNIYYEDSSVLDKYYEVLSKEQVELEKINETNYIGKVDIESDNEYVLFTIPYDEGWKATVNGEETDVIRVQDELMAVKVNKGENVIELKFAPRGFYVGLCVSMFGLLIFAILGVGKIRKYILTYKKS